MDELEPRAAVSDPFRPAERIEDDSLEDADDGSASRRAARLQRLGYLVSRGATAVVLVAAGALTARVVWTQPAPVPIDAPSETSSGGAPEITTPDYPELRDLLGNDATRKPVKSKPKGRAEVRRFKIRLGSDRKPDRRPTAGSGPAHEPIAPPAAPAPPQPTDNPGTTEDRDRKNVKDRARDQNADRDGDREKRAKPEPPPKPDRNLFHVWKQGTSDHVYYWEEWKTVDYFAPQEYYLYRDGNGSEGSFFSEQVEGTIPLRTDDGPLGFVYSSGGDGRLPLYYLRGPTQKRRRDLFTTDAGTKEAFMSKGWADYGVVGYLGQPFQE